MGFLKKTIGFVSRPTQSRTMGILIFFVLVAAVSLTVYVAQQQQSLRQRAAERLSVPSDQCRPPYEGNMGCLPIKVCADNSLISSNVSCTDGAGKEGVWCYKSTKKNANCSIVKDNATIPGVCDDSGNCSTNSAPKTNADSCEPSDCSSLCMGDAVCKPLNRVCICQKDTATPTPTSASTPTPTPAAGVTAPTDCTAAGGTCKDSSSECLVNETFKLTNQCLSKIQACCIPNLTPASTPGPCPDGKTVNGRYHICAGSATLCTTGGGRIESGTCILVERVCCSSPPQAPTATAIPQLIQCSIDTDEGQFRCRSNCFLNEIVVGGSTTCSLDKASPVCCLDRSKRLPTPTPIPTSQCIASDCGLCAVGSSCKQNPTSTIKNCTCQSDALPTPTSTPAPTSSFLNVTLVMALNVQDAILSDDPLPVKLALYNLTTNTLVSGAPATQSFTRTPIPQRQYAANISLTNLAINKYFIVARRDNMIAKSVFTVKSASTTITVPTTTLVFGDINKDNDINALDYQLLRPCYKKTITANASCLASDFDKNEVIDQIDLNTLLRGWATWNKEGKEL